MFTKIVLALVVFCAVTYVKSDKSYGRNYRMPEYVRIKRAKYYSNPPMRFYRRPPIPEVVRGIFSYTPPPSYMEEESPHPGNPGNHPGSFKPAKVSKRPTSSDVGLGQNDINNLVKHLSKQDLDKIINIAGEKYKEYPLEKFSSSQNALIKDSDDLSIYKPTLREFDTNERFSQGGPYMGGNTKLKEDFEYNDRYPEASSNTESFRYIGPYAPSYTGPKMQTIKPVQVFYLNQPQNLNNNLQDAFDVPFETQESTNSNQFSFVDAYIKQELNSAPAHRINVNNDFTDGNMVQEEQLPKPVNLREDDYQASNTDNVPRFVKPSSYKVENFGNLPLMDYNSKLHTVSSYHVPHYTVISQQSQQPSSQSSSSQLLSSPSSQGIRAPTIERAPHPSAAKEQSDAHLKAIKIWTHMSSGTAYTLHDDGTLSLERGGRPKPVYGRP